MTKRQFLTLGLAPLFPRIATSGFSIEPDVVIVGAGAAGLAAAKTLKTFGKTVTVIEASSRIGGRAVTDFATFGVPFDVGAHWVHNGRRNPYHDYARSNGFHLQQVPHSYRLFSSSSEEVDDENLNSLWNDHRQVTQALSKSGSEGHDIAASDAVKHLSGRWLETAKFVEGPWSMGKDFNEFSTLDWWNSDDGSDYVCPSGFGSLVAHYGSNVDVSLNTQASRIDSQGDLLRVETNKGTIKSRAVILTVSTGVLSSESIQFVPSLPIEKQESFDAISMGAYEHIALLFSHDVFELGRDGYLLFEVDEDQKGFGTLTNASDTGLAYCDVGGNWAIELHKETTAGKIHYALEKLQNLLGNSVRKAFLKGTATNWLQNPMTLGAYASAQPGAYAMRFVLREPVADKIFFAGEANHLSLWATVGGAHLSGEETARAVLNALA